MEEQHGGDPSRDVDAISDLTNSTTLSSSELTLRFPRPQGNRHLASWISSSEPDIMNPSNATDDTGELAESSYEFINTDDDIESQDDRGTEAEAESLSSLDYARPDDVHSLDDVERTDDTASRSDMDSDDDQDDDDAAEDRSRASSIQYAEQSLMSPSSGLATPPLQLGNTVESVNTVKSVHSRQPIEFEETQSPVYIKQVSVKHVTHTFSNEQSASIARTLNLSESQKTPLTAAVRQTMAHSCLILKEPLRILYNGSEWARQDITQKFYSALKASAGQQSDDEYNKEYIPNSTPVKLLQVEECTSAKELVYQGEQFPGDTVFSLTVNNSRSFQSAFAPSGSLIEPPWILPHVTVFFVDEGEDETVRETREAAWGFMQRHSVPCIFVSNKELFQNPTENWSDYINAHAIHRCVESSGRTFPSVRLPIDLKSFKEIDDRQMNRNLAYLTGLYEVADAASHGSDLRAQSTKMLRSLSQYIVDASEGVDFSSLAQTLFLGFIVITSLLLGNWCLSSGTSIPAVSTTPAHSSVPVVSTSATSGPTSTITINLTSTTTIRVPQAKASPANTGVIPFAEFADFIADKFPESQKSYVCSAEKFGRNEILVKIPSSTKTSWLSKDSITIDVTRGEESVKTKFSSIDEGILIEIPKKMAYGVITVAINTTRKPRVNETFAVDFGKTGWEQCLGYSKSIASYVYDKADAALAISHVKDVVVEDLKDVSGRLAAEAANAAKQAKESLKPGLSKTWQDVQQSLQDMRKSRHAQDALDWADIQHKKAQIQSWLLLLRLQCKTEQHDTYLKKAQKYLSEKKLAADKASKERLNRERMELRARRKRERLEARCQSGFSRWTQQCKQQE
ncbi:hypothetical protein C8034_v004237 [Colletotrichum sidae]|uniref:Uncharacterized protein n=1 Tax=Colletotrichum sidae TaxID=1347389 RepID=A0A4R8TN97_9PEZI|nr:hypothetical protein C8034_v004237 [Colletotrichum sidae]